MKKREIKKHLINGLKVRRASWDAGVFIYVENNTVKHSETKKGWNEDIINGPNFNTNPIDDWEILN